MLNDFKSQALKSGGARANLFMVEGNIGNNSDDGLLKFMCKSASIPASEIGEIIVPWRGRQFKMPGDRTFGDWELTILEDADHDLRHKFEAWSQTFQHHFDNVSEDGDLNVPIYQDWKIHWLGRDGAIKRTYNFVGCWPKNIGATEVAFDTNDTLAEFSVTMAYQWWTSPATDGNAV